MEQAFAWNDYIVHLPKPEDFGVERAQAKAQMLADVRYLLVVGSLRRPRRLAEFASAELGMKHVGSYFDIVEDWQVGDREFCVEVVDLGLDTPATVAIASHGIGGSGAEIVIAELSALIRYARQSLGLPDIAPIRAVGRSGTRGTLGDQAYGTVGISTASYAPDFDVAHPDPQLLQLCLEVAREMKLPTALAPGMSTPLFWSGQGRALPPQGPVQAAVVERRRQAAEELLWPWVERGIEFIEMEDYTVHSVCQRLGIPSISAGAIIARRFDKASGHFVLDYDEAAKKRSELYPARIILELFKRHMNAQD